MVNVIYIKKVLKKDGGYVLLETGNQLPIARRRKEQFLEFARSMGAENV